MTCSAATLISVLKVSGCRDIESSSVNDGRDALPLAVEIERVRQPQFNLLSGLQRLVRVGKRHQRLALIVQMYVILFAEVLDPVHAADQPPAIARGDLQVFGANADRLRSGRESDLGNETGGHEVELGCAKPRCNVPDRKSTRLNSSH